MFRMRVDSLMVIIMMLISHMVKIVGINFQIRFQKQKIKIFAYNGSGFDFYFLIDYLKDKNIPIKNLILSNGAILSFKFGVEGKENKVFDLYRFLISSLDKACQAYKIENKKIKFDVLKIQSWDLAEKYRDEVEPYLKYDVLSLSELFLLSMIQFMKTIK